MRSQLPDSSGSSIPSHISRVEPLRPEWPSWMPIFAPLRSWTNETIRRQDSSCSALYIPVQPGVIRPVGETQTISVITRPAPPSALLPRCTRWKSPGTPSRAEYMSIGETITRLASSRPPRRNGWNNGGRPRGAPQHPVLGPPRTAPHGAEAHPPRVVREQLVPAEHVGAQAAAHLDRRLIALPGRQPGRALGRRPEPGPPPYVLVHPQDEGAGL